jgi:alkanesulfonate monooxygenase SsuD/methylene tetrahydromethanopterin reductase-like flavin-dependent oxidoreductase (luciferase family)
MLVDEDGDRARAIAKKPLEDYLHSLVDAASDWTEGLSSSDYPGYDKVIGKLKTETMETQIASGAAWIGSPADVRATIEGLQEQYGGFEHASLQINFNLLPQAEALRSLELFAREVMPHLVREVATV